MVFALFAASFCFADDAAKIAQIKTFSKASESREVLFSTGFDTPRNANEKMPPGFAVKPGEGRNGTAALFYERTDPNAYPLYNIRLDNLEPGRRYAVSVWVRGDGIQARGQDKNIGAFCVEYSKNGKWVGGTYYSTTAIGTDWTRLSHSFLAEADRVTTLKLYLRKQIVGKIWFDDLDVQTEEISPTILLTGPDRLSFFGENGKLRIRLEKTAPKHPRLFVSVFNDGRTRELLLEPESQDSLDYTADAGPLRPGPVEITAKLVDMDKKRIAAETTFLLQAYPETAPPKNACTIDEYGRAIVDGKPFMPLGVYGFADEKNYKRIAEAGFNCLQLYNSLGLKGNVDHQDPIKNALDGMDLIDKYGLKLIFSLKDQFPHHDSSRKKWGGADGIDAVSELAVKTVKDHPALLAWYISDEEMRDDVPLILELRRRISRIDPWHPTWTLTYRYDDLPYYGISGDLIGVDPYPISERHGEQSIGKIKTAMDAGRSTGLPVWVVPQIFNWGVYKLRDKPEEFAKSYFPTTGELRAMPLYAAILGARGFVFYSNFDIMQRYDRLLPGSGEREWAKVVEAIRPLKELEPYILSKNKPVEIAVSCEPADSVVAGALLDDRGRFRVVVIGTGGKAKGTFVLPESLLRLNKEPLTSEFGKTRSLGDGQYEFNADAVDSDILK